MTITHLVFMVCWAIWFVFFPILVGSVHILWYLGGTVMGAVLMVGFSVIEWRRG